MNLIEEAKQRGYKTGSIIDYGEDFNGTDTLGCGEFKIIGDKLIKYELNDSDSCFRRFDTIYSKGRWVKLVDKPRGLHFNANMELINI
jgi:hypothetical protein